MRQLFALCLLLAANAAAAQQTLLFENFNECKLPTGWAVNIKGNQNVVWRVGYAQNEDAKDSSIDGSCFVVIDDDSTGENTPAYIFDVISPVFDASKFSTLRFTADVHYRDWKDADESFQVLLSDGVSETLIAAFGPERTNGELFADHFDLSHDLALLTQSPNARLIFRYDDGGGGFGWWAGFDNVQVIGSGGGSNVLTETFNDCKLPAGWETKILSGDEDWKFGLIDTSSEAYWSGTSMDGTCFVYFDDDILGEKAPFSAVQLKTPWIDGSAFSNYFLNLDAILRFEKEKLSVWVEHPDGNEFLVVESNGDVGGPGFPKYLNVTLDLSTYRNKQMRVVFKYDDGRTWGWWAGIDNVKITGFGASIDLCDKAFPLQTGAPCIATSNTNAIFDGPAPLCAERNVGSLWFKWKADFTGTARFASGAQFNDVVNVFTGGCPNLSALACNDRDEHGFTGESTWFQAQAGTEYLIRISGKEANFGIPRGNVCASIEASAPPVFPANDDCANATPLSVDAACVSGNNRNAATSNVIPSLNKLARADVWYKFTAPALGPNEQLVLESGASFSDIITVYKGSCGALEEVTGNHKGGTLTLRGLSNGQTYYVQVAGNFATIEGRLCIRLVKRSKTPPSNDDCLSAINIPVGATCTSSNTLDAAFSGKKPPCVPEFDRDVWFKFTAPVSGSINVNTGADFEHVVAIWQGDCNNLAPLYCLENPLRCNGFAHIGGLEAGKTYFVQIGTWSAGKNPGTGALCLKILDGNVQPDFQALVLQVEEKCKGKNISEIRISATGGVAPYTVQGSQNGDQVPSGTPYIVVLSDATGCQQSHVALAKACEASECNLSASLTATDPRCNDQKDGSLSTSAANGKPPFQYKWSDGSSNEALSNIGGGIYTCTITDAAGCEAIVTDTLINPAPIFASPLEIKKPWIGQSNGKIDIEISGGKPPYVANWFREGFLFGQNIEDLINVPAGNYRVDILDANGCMMSFTFTLTETVSTHAPDADIFAEIFPNPARDKATLAIATPRNTTLYLRLNDALGRTVQAWTLPGVSEQNIPVEVHHLPAGAYQLHILTEDGYKIVKPLAVLR